MQGPRRLRWYFPWLPIGLAAAVAALTAFLFLAAPPGVSRAEGATLSERHAVGYQTTDKLILAFNLPSDVDPGNVGPEGVAQAEFKVPQAPAGPYKMTVLTRSTLGQDALEQEVVLKTAPKVLLTTDKPLYQPGQTIRMRVLALEGFNLT